MEKQAGPRRLTISQYIQTIKTELSNNLYSDYIPYKEGCVPPPPELKATGRGEKKYYNIPAAFDIETTSFYEGGEKRACMYAWMFGLCGHVILGRTWEEFQQIIVEIVEKYKVTPENKLIVYVHNLAFDFQFFRKWLNIEKVFATDDHKPLYADTVEGLEFRCSYQLSGYSLAVLGKNLNFFKVKKMVGDLDYDLYRTSETPLTPKEIGYCINDVRVVMCYIMEEIEKEGGINRLPLTKTGYVRKHCQQICLSEKNYYNYRKIMSRLTIESDEYKQLKRAFQGGFTHANAYKVGKTFLNVRSMDFTSSYPAVMISEKFPMGKGRLIDIQSIEQFESIIKNYCCLFDVCFIGLKGKPFFEHPLSSSKLTYKENVKEDNGRVVTADVAVTTITEQDYLIYKNFYTWEAIEIKNCRVYNKNYLPTEFVKCILELYKSKTELKGVKGKEVEYMKGKGMLNSTFGMSVTDIVRALHPYEGDEWLPAESAELDEAITGYNSNKKRFLSYAWGVWITAYARRNLFTAIYVLGPDYIYSDTDSVKFLHPEKYDGYFKHYNEVLEKKLHEAMIYHKLPYDAVKPKTIKGKVKLLGAWDFDGDYRAFKTLGAKRYLTRDMNYETAITIAGLGKQTGAKYLIGKYGAVGCFDHFNTGLTVPAEETGKMTHTYIDYETMGNLTDYLGHTAEYHELSSVHLEPAAYSLSLAVNFINYLKEIKERKKCLG